MGTVVFGDDESCTKCANARLRLRGRHMRTPALRLTLTILLVGLLASVVSAQVPDTPAGRQLSAWMKAQDSADLATIQQFIEKNMPWGRADQELAIHNQTGGFEVKRVESSSDTQIVALA